VWSHLPTPAELLGARVARGWQPIPSALASGPEVLGYARCLTEPGHSQGCTKQV
jgi:hypothetical protein